ncbi:MAG: enoyl-CoA hydratase-related protein [Actinomycetota bacterium]
MAVHYQLENDVAVITLSRPDRFNAISADLSSGLVAALSRAGEESRALVVTGSGKAFCTGADLSDLLGEYERGGPDLSKVVGERFNPIAHRLLTVPVPTIAAVNGAAAGAGVGMALACDLRVLSAEAFFLSAFIKLGLIPDTGSTWLLVRHLGLSRAIEFTASNRRMPAVEAAALGLGQVVESDRLMPVALELATGLASGPTPAYAANRQALYGAAALDFEAALDAERDLQGALGASPLHLEGMRAFIEKRPADFRRVPGS